MATAASDTEENIFGFTLISFLSLNVAWVHSVIPGHQIRLATPSLEKISPTCQGESPQSRIADSSSTNAVNLSSARTMKRFPSRCVMGTERLPEFVLA
jgi:hypothetical protein